MVENGSAEISESEKNIKQIASIWGAAKSVCYSVITVLDIVAPLFFGVTVMMMASFAYHNSLSDTKVLIGDFERAILTFSSVWTLICMPMQIVIYNIKRHAKNFSIQLKDKADKTETSQ